MRALALSVVLVAGCSVDRSGLAGSDAAGIDAPSTDAPAADVVAPDLGPIDLGPPDLGPPDLGPPDLGPPDLGPPDLGCTMELCNGIDDDCNGAIDDGAACFGCVGGTYGGHLYLFCDMNHSFTTSDTMCASHGYHLATIEDAGEDTYVASTARGIHATGWWIGYTELGMPYHWLAGTSSYTGWASGEPTGGTEHCALTAWTGGTAGSWNDGDCTHGFPFVCEVPP